MHTCVLSCIPSRTKRIHTRAHSLACYARLHRRFTDTCTRGSQRHLAQESEEAAGEAREAAVASLPQGQGLEHGKASQNARNRCERLLRQAQLLCDQGCLAKVVKQELQALRYAIVELGPGWHRRRSSHREPVLRCGFAPRLSLALLGPRAVLREAILGVQSGTRACGTVTVRWQC